MILNYKLEDKFNNSELHMGVGFSDMSEPKNKDYARKGLFRDDFEKTEEHIYKNRTTIGFGLSKSNWGIITHAMAFDENKMVGFIGLLKTRKIMWQKIQKFYFFQEI